MDIFLWFALVVIFLLVEAATVTMVSAWFAAGALAAMIAALIGARFWLQTVVFVVVAGITLALLRPVAKKYFNPRVTRTNVDALAGKTCLVVTAIDNLNGCGQVKLGGVEWSARSTDGAPIPVGTEVKIERVEGVKLYVTPCVVEVK